MRHAGLAAAMLFAFWPVTVCAQTVEGYLVGGVGGWRNPFTGGVLLGGGGGAGVNVTSLAAIELDGSALVARGGMLLALSAGGRVRFVRLSDGAVAPFLVGGVSNMLFFPGGPRAGQLGWHVGGGVELVRTRNRTIRLEFRDTIDHPSHYWVVRAGVGFR